MDNQLNKDNYKDSFEIRICGDKAQIADTRALLAREGIDARTTLELRMEGMENVTLASQGGYEFQPGSDEKSLFAYLSESTGAFIEAWSTSPSLFLQRHLVIDNGLVLSDRFAQAHSIQAIKDGCYSEKDLLNLLKGSYAFHSYSTPDDIQKAVENADRDMRDAIGGFSEYGRFLNMLEIERPRVYRRTYIDDTLEMPARRWEDDLIHLSVSGKTEDVNAFRILEDLEFKSLIQSGEDERDGIMQREWKARIRPDEQGVSLEEIFFKASKDLNLTVEFSSTFTPIPENGDKAAVRYSDHDYHLYQNGEEKSCRSQKLFNINPALFSAGDLSLICLVHPEFHAYRSPRGMIANRGADGRVRTGLEGGREVFRNYVRIHEREKELCQSEKTRKARPTKAL